MREEKLGQRLRERRERSGLSQREVAEALQVSPQAVSKWERGESAPDIGLLVPLCRLLDVSVERLSRGGSPTAAISRRPCS